MQQLSPHTNFYSQMSAARKNRGMMSSMIAHFWLLNVINATRIICSRTYCL